MSAADFLASHWQTSSLYLPKSIDPLTPSLTPDELAWLATQDDVESRLVFTEYDQDGSNCRTRYRVEDGPFESEYLGSLPDRNWTLLVQDVEKHLPDFRQLLSQADFIPDWRFDDIMISFATPGGGVGPHKDNYDVFLCQGVGRREWRVGQPEQTTLDTQAEQLSLLQPFIDPAANIIDEGDVLYIPPGIPHWGIAVEACTTYSIGMRAPTIAELQQVFHREFPNAADPFPRSYSDKSIFYTDADLRVSESSPGCISAHAIERVRENLQSGAHLPNADIATMLGCAATELKAWLTPESPSKEDLDAFLQTDSISPPLSVHGMARLAWWAEGDAVLLFANGHRRKAPTASLHFIKSVCSDRLLAAGQNSDGHNEEHIRWLLDMGVFDL